MRMCWLHAIVLVFLVYSTGMVAASPDDGWTPRLGLQFKEDCQEEIGLSSWVAWAMSWISGKKGQRKDSHCETKEFVCASGAMTGLQVRYTSGVLHGSDRDFYDFAPRCGSYWQSWLGMRFDTPPGAPDAVSEATLCPRGEYITGVQVMRGRNDRSDEDFLNFKLRCVEWGPPLGLPFSAFREKRSATCPRGRRVDGIRVHRGFQDWGDIDTYEFQLHCTPAMPNSAAGASPLSRGGGGGSGGGGGGAFSARAAAAAEAAAELRAEMRGKHDEV